MFNDIKLASDILSALADSLKYVSESTATLLYMETNADITSVVSRLKIIGNMNIAETPVPDPEFIP